MVNGALTPAYRNLTSESCARFEVTWYDAWSAFWSDRISLATWSGGADSAWSMIVWSCALAWVWRVPASFMVFWAIAMSVWMSSMRCWPGCLVRACVTRRLSAATCPPEYCPVGEVENVPNTATACSSLRIASSFACAPYCTVTESSTRAIAVERGEPGPSLPRYHFTVVAEPLTSVVAELAGDEPTRSGGCVAVIGVELKPSDARAVLFELVMLRLPGSSVLIVITPPWMVDGFVVPVI